MSTNPRLDWTDDDEREFQREKMRIKYAYEDDGSLGEYLNDLQREADNRRHFTELRVDGLRVVLNRNYGLEPNGDRIDEI
jgi:hypothetical protein